MWGRVLRPEDACQKRLSWFFDWNQKVQRNVKDSCKSCRSRQALSKESSFRTDSYSKEYLVKTFCFDTSENEFSNVFQKVVSQFLSKFY